MLLLYSIIPIRIFEYSTTALDVIDGADVGVVLSTALHEQPQWAYGYGVGWGNRGYEYSGWGISASNYIEADDTQLPTQQTATEDATKETVYSRLLSTEQTCT